MNHITLMGRLTHNPELRRVASGTAVTTFTLAVDRGFTSKDGGERQTDFIDIVAWQQRAEFVSKYFSKGQMCAVSGRLQIRDWTDAKGIKRRSAEVVADNIYFTGDKTTRGDTSNTYDNSGYTTPVSGSGFAELDMDDGDLPF